MTSTLQVGTSYVDLTGSNINYKPPTGTKQISYKFNYYARKDEGSYLLSHIKVFVDNVEYTVFNHSEGNVAGHVGFSFTVKAIFEIGETNDAANGKFLTWDENKEIKIMVREFDSTNSARFHEGQYFDGGATYPLFKPRMEVQAIGESTTTSGSTGSSSSQWTTNGDDIHYNSGNVGIGTTDPTKYYYNANENGQSFSSAERILTIRSGTSGLDNGTCRIVLSCDANHTSSILAQHTGGGNTYMSFFTTTGTAAPSERMRIDKDGNVGIGTIDPQAGLDVDSTKSIYLGTLAYLNSAGNTGTYPYNGNRDIAIRCRGYLWTSDGAVLVSSDGRIKENIVDVPDNLALEMVRKIPCRYYEYKDKFSMGSEKTIGFIAQEVKEQLPIAVSIEKEIIPNEMRILTDISWNNTTLHTDLTDCSGVKYRFYVSNDVSGNDEIRKEVVGNADNSFTFEEKWDNVFCYGKEVDDFHTLDKQKLFALNFSATQELDKKVIELEAKVASQETLIQTLIARIEALENN